MPVNLFQSGAVSVQFNTPPTRDGGESPELIQATGYDSDGVLWCYDKGRILRTRYGLTFPRVSDAILAALRSFETGTVRGNRTAFTWYDHAGTTRTVRISGELRHQQIGPDRHRVQIDLEEELPWGAVATTWDAAKNSTSAAPVWILKLTVNAVAYYLSESTITVPAWGITTKAWIRQWGAVQEGITNGLDEFRVADLSVDLLTDPAANPHMETLATTYPLEKSPAELYLWFAGAVDAPRMVFRGYVRDVDIPDETGVSLVIEDESSRLQNYLGTKVDRAAYPSADPDDVGKMIPIVIGTVEKLPALAVDAGIMTSLPASITAAATSIPVSDPAGLLAGMTVQVDDEQLTIGAVSGSTLTGCTRGVNGTLATTHQKAAQIWEVRSSFAYLVADHAVDAITKVFGKVGDVLLDITAVCSLYPSGNHPTYPGKAAVALPGYVTVQQAVALWPALTGNIAKSGAISLYGAIAKAGTNQITGNIADYSISETGHSHNAAIATSGNTTTGLPVTSAALDGLYGWTYPQFLLLQFSAPGSRTDASYTITITPSYTMSNVRVMAYAPVNSARYFDQFYNLVAGSSFTIQFSTGSLVEDEIHVVMAFYVGHTFTVTSASRTVQGGSNPSSANLAGVTKTLANNGTLGVTDPSVNNGTLGVTDPSVNNGTLGVQLSGNSVANTQVCDQLLVNVVRSFASPLAAMQSVLSAGGSSLVISQSGTLPGSYALNGAITEYKTAREWLDIMAFQLRSWFRCELGTARLIVRPDALASVKTIPACRITEDGRKTHRRKKAALSDVVNKVDLLYDRDWSASGAEAYRQVSKGTNAASIGDFGTRERPELFQMDFVTSAAMAASVRDFYLAWCGKRPWLHEFETYLNHAELKFGNAITLGFSGNTVGQIIEAGPAPGAEGRIDTIKFTVAV